MSSIRLPDSELIAIVSDIHFDLHCPYTWAAFRAWHSVWKPARTVILGDFLDLGMLSRYVQGSTDPIRVIPQIKTFVRECNALAREAGEVLVVEGNHDERWARLFEGKGGALLGALGLTLEDQCRAHGLNESVGWFIETVDTPSVSIGNFIARHGHRQAGRFGAGLHVAANALRKYRGGSVVFGHHHRAQMFCHTSGGRTDFAIANPCMTIDHEYSPDADWQRGFTILEHWKKGREVEVTPHVIVSNAGAFSWAGKVYDGRELLAAARKKARRDSARRRGR